MTMGRGRKCGFKEQLNIRRPDYGFSGVVIQLKVLF